MTRLRDWWLPLVGLATLVSGAALRLHSGLCTDKGLCTVTGPLSLTLAIGFPMDHRAAALVGVWAGTAVCIAVLGPLATCRAACVCIATMVAALLAWFVVSLLVELSLEEVSTSSGWVTPLPSAAARAAQSWQSSAIPRGAAQEAGSSEGGAPEGSVPPRSAASSIERSRILSRTLKHRCAALHIAIVPGTRAPPGAVRALTCDGNPHATHCRLGAMCLNHSSPAAWMPCEWLGPPLRKQLAGSPVTLYETKMQGLGSAVYNRMVECAATSAALATRAGRHKRLPPSIYFIPFDAVAAMFGFANRTDAIGYAHDWRRRLERSRAWQHCGGCDHVLVLSRPLVDFPRRSRCAASECAFVLDDPFWSRVSKLTVRYSPWAWAYGRAGDHTLAPASNQPHCT